MRVKRRKNAMNGYYSLILTFLFGGAVCAAAQLLIDLTRLTPARILVLYVVTGVLLYGVGAYEPLFEILGCGISVPLVGFGATIGRGVKEAVDELGALGILSGGLSASAAGITAALVLGVFFSLFTHGGAKRM